MQGWGELTNPFDLFSGICTAGEVVLSGCHVEGEASAILALSGPADPP